MTAIGRWSAATFSTGAGPSRSFEEFDELYYEPIRAVERTLRENLAGGRRHLHEAELKEGDDGPAAWVAMSRVPPQPMTPNVPTAPRGGGVTDPLPRRMHSVLHDTHQVYIAFGVDGDPHVIPEPFT